jgi:cyclic pyranopterin phosphate synthase
VIRLRGKAIRALRWLVGTRAGLKRALIRTDVRLAQVHHSLASRFPILVRPRTEKMTVAVTARCNLRCVGCRYERDFHVGHELSLAMTRELLEDGRRAGVDTVRLYGGEPLLHRDLPAMVSHATGLGYSTYVTTNGILLDRKIRELHDAGLRNLTIGFYGTGERYDAYVGRKRQFAKLCASLDAVREHCGSDMRMQLNYLIMRPSCSLEDLHAAWEFAERYDMTFHTDLVHYSLPYFTEGPEGELQFRPEDLPAIRAVTDELVRLKQAHPFRIPESAMSLRSIPDWLLDGPEMRIPCDVYKMIWVGADGSVKLCYVTFDLGNLHQTPLRDILYSPEHERAARDAFLLRCPNCHCERDSRIQRHGPSRRRYGAGEPDRAPGRIAS